MNLHTEAQYQQEIAQCWKIIDQQKQFLENQLPEVCTDEQSDVITFRHKKTGNLYEVVGNAINATNAQDGQNVIIYQRDGCWYVREQEEFFEKFEAVE